MTRFVVAALAVLSLSACSDVLMPVDEDSDASAFRAPEGSAEAFGILSLVNDPATTYDVLDLEVGLDARAARSIVWHRNGPDGLYGTADDNRLRTMQELDDLWYVGRSALADLQDYAYAYGYVPGEDDFVGTWDGVDFTWGETRRTLELANTASQSDLDDTFELDGRAVKGIVEGRPFQTMDELSEAYYVGGSALKQLKFYADQLLLAGEGETCAVSADCADGLVCLGELAWGQGIYCIDAEEAAGTYTQTPVLPIPDGAMVSDSVKINDLLSVPVDVKLTLDIDHARPSDLVVLLEDGNGQVATIWDREEAPESEVIVRAFPSDDMVNGKWTLTVIDEARGVEGTLVSWELYIVSTWD